MFKSIKEKTILIFEIIAASKEIPNDREIAVKITESIKNPGGNSG